MSKPTAHVVLVQPDIEWESRDVNHRRVRELLAAHRPPTGSLVVLPEMFSSGFSMNVRAIADDETRPTEHFLARLAVELGVHVTAGIVRRDAISGRGRNESLTIDPAGSVVARYVKLHPFTPGQENDDYIAGSEIVTFAFAGLTVSPFICYDLRFPEIFRRATRRGAQVFTVIANWPDSRIGHWVTLLQARAIENQAYVVGVNRVGTDPTRRYNGRSMVVDPFGTIVADAAGTETCIAATLDAPRLLEYRASMPFLSDMRDDLR